MNMSFDTSYSSIIQEVLFADYIPWNILQNKSIFITGATGMIGTVIVDVLQLLNAERKYNIDITVLTRNAEKAAQRFLTFPENKKIKYIEQDITEHFPEDFHADFIFCGASTTHPVAYSNDPFGTINVNIEGTTNCIRLARQNPGSRTIFFSSCEIYGENKQGLESFSEEDCGYINCNTMRACYNESKRLCECLMQTAKQKFGIDFVTVRLSRVFGPTMLMNDSKASSQFIRNALHKQDIVLKSAGKQRYSYTFVMDAVTGIFTVLLKGGGGEVYNISGEPIHLYDFAKYCADAAGTKIIFEQADKTEAAGFSAANDSVLSTVKIRKLGWKPVFSIQAGINATLKIFKSFEEGI